MKKFVLCILTVCLTTPTLHTTPPTFSQRYSLCWMATWVQFIYNIKPIIDRYLNDPTAFTDFETFKKKHGANPPIRQIRSGFGDRTEEIYGIANAENFFLKKMPDINRSYGALFTAMRKDPQNQALLDEHLEKLARLMCDAHYAGNAFGCKGEPPKILDKASFIVHPIFADLITYVEFSINEVGTVDSMLTKKNFTFTRCTPIMLIGRSLSGGYDITKSFTLDIAPHLAPGTTCDCTTYELIGITMIKENFHWFAFIKDQYDPSHPWWRADTMYPGNRRVTIEEIIKTCTEPDGYQPKTLVYLATNCATKTSEPVNKQSSSTTSEDMGVMQSEVQNGQDLKQLARVLWELSK